MRYKDLAAEFIAAGQAISNYRPTFAEAVTVFAIGTAFACDEEGALCVYRRTAEYPFYTLIYEVPTHGEFASKASFGDLASPDPEKGVALLRKGQANLRDILPVTPQEYGAKATGVDDDYAAIIAARDKAVATGRVLHFPDGRYAFGATLEFGCPNLQVTFGKVTLLPLHSGRAISFDGGRAAAAHVAGVEFGWGNPALVQGNADTTDLLYVRGSHHMKLDARLRDGETGMRVEFSVLSHFRLNLSSNQGGWEVQNPTSGLVVDRRETHEATTACKFEMIVEGVHGRGVDLIAAQHCEFWGTSEANSGGGVYIGVDSTNNNFYNVFCEQNGAGPHWEIAGHYNVFINCTSGGVSNSGENTALISGVRNHFLNGNWHNVTETGYYNKWSLVHLTGALNMSVLRIQEKCFNDDFAELTDWYPAGFIEPVLEGLWVHATGQREAGYRKGSGGMVTLRGAVKDGDAGTVIFTLPSGYRPGGTIWAQYYNPVFRTTGAIAVGANGEVRHIVGDNSAVTLDGISFVVEG